MQYVTLAASPNCIGQIIGKPWYLPGHVDVEWLWSLGHDWRSPQRYEKYRLRKLEGEFEVLKAEILEREKRE
jgi:hypothetical protein